MESSSSYCMLCRSEFSSRPSRCVHCGCTMCPKCVSAHAPNREFSVVCNMCSDSYNIEESLKLPCARCNTRQLRGAAYEFFCSTCAAPLCSACLSTSFEGGNLKCARCCSHPVAHRLDRCAAPNHISESYLSVLATPQPSASAASNHPAARASPYHTLLDKSELGAGAQGVVYKCRTPDGQIVVSKEMSFNESERDTFEAQLQQALRMRQLKHRHLIRYLDVYPTYGPLRLYVIMPYYDLGDLSKFISAQRGPVTEYKLCSIVLQIATALQYLHTQKPPLVHRDIKPDNILLDSKDEVLLMDLDLCGSVDMSTRVAKGRNASPTYEYKAPELENSMGSVKSDVFSLGVVMFLLATLPEFAWLTAPSGTKMVLGAHEWTPTALEAALRQAVLNVRNYDYSQRFTDLLVSMLRHDPQRRPTSVEVCDALPAIMENALMGRRV